MRQSQNAFVTKNWPDPRSAEQFDQTPDNECDDIANFEPKHVASYKSPCGTYYKQRVHCSPVGHPML
jgi:hypothetical protein